MAGRSGIVPGLAPAAAAGLSEAACREPGLRFKDAAAELDKQIAAVNVTIYVGCERDRRLLGEKGSEARLDSASTVDVDKARDSLARKQRLRLVFQP